MAETCAFRKSYPDVMVVQPRQDRDGDNDPLAASGVCSFTTCSELDRQRLDVGCFMDLLDLTVVLTGSFKASARSDEYPESMESRQRDQLQGRTVRRMVRNTCKRACGKDW